MFDWLMNIIESHECQALTTLQCNCLVDAELCMYLNESRFFLGNWCGVFQQESYREAIIISYSQPFE